MMPTFDDDFWKDIAPGEGYLSGPLGEFGIHTEAEPTCSDACPAGVDVKAYVNLIADKRFEQAVDVIRRSNPFPGVCGRVCTHPCESECRRSETDDPLAIRALKRFASDYEMSRKVPVSPVQPGHEEKVAVVGAGPAGLTAAANLAYEGFSVDVYDSAPVAGGIMAWGIPDFRLPKLTLRSEVKDIEDLGVRILLDEHIRDPKGLLEKGYSAVVLAVGCMTAFTLGLAGEESDSVIDCLEFLRKANLEEHGEMAGKVLVIGGGSAALDSARTVIRLGAEATVVYRRSVEQMPASPDEIREAEEEGVNFKFLAMPKELKIEGSKLRALKCQRTELGDADESGRCRPVPVDEFFELEADIIILAIGSRPDASAVGQLQTTEWGKVVADDRSMTSVTGIFAAGDTVTGPASIVDAIGSGHEAARGVIEYLTGKSVHTPTTTQMLVVAGKEPEPESRHSTTCIPSEQRSSGFDEVDLGFDEITAMAEASRCRRCGSCTVCDVCLGVCEHTQAMATDGSGNSVIVKVPAEIQKNLLDEPSAGSGWTLSVGSHTMNITLSPLIAQVDAAKCIACGICDEVCVYRAVRVHFSVDDEPTAVVDASACRACGACSAACPTGAISQGFMGWPELRKRFSEGTAAFSCIWRNSDGLVNDGIGMMCTRAASPALILEALARGSKGVAVIGCEDDCHYLPGPWMGEDVVGATKGILAAAGLDPERIIYINSAEAGEDFNGTIIDKFNVFEPTPCPVPDIDSQVGIALHIAKELARVPGGKAAIEDAVLSAYCLEGPGQLFESKASVEALGDPEFLPTQMTVALHSCFDRDTEVELLYKIPALNIVIADEDCGQTGWNSPTVQSRKQAIQLLAQAESKGADVLVTDSAECLTHLKTIQRGWRQSGIKVADIYTFVLSRLKEGES
jgi:NADPH-dependent glutamate synthase beta subunit-like oxidoreductase/NAD-dependent dihydropyrimidine dehydrogenase PreA subunit